MSIRYINVNCEETAKIDLRQANAVLKYKPDIIFLEYPNNQKELKPIKKPITGFSEETIKTNPWALSDIHMWKNIEALWKEKPEAAIYATDGPTDLVREMLYEWQYMYPCAKKNWFWWVRIYLREQFMAKHVGKILSSLSKDKQYTVLVFLEKFHWIHVKFLLTNPTKKEIWAYYFSRFKDIDPAFVEKKLKERNRVFHKYWKRFSL